MRRGVQIVDPRQTFVAAEVRPERVCEGVILHPGTRLHGERTFVGPGAEIGTQGPATLRNAVLGRGAGIEAGWLDGAVLLDGARAGWGAHFRPGTILEEQASTAHTVGLKHTILMAFVTAGSLINFCDALVAGGTSRADHSEIGSGFIHFNFTPWGERGDKATPSLVGDVVRGVFLRERRIFLGGVSGLVGPTRVGYGAITGAGQVIRKDVGEDVLSVEVPRAVEVQPTAGLGHVEPRRGRNVAYIGELVALRCWYRQVRRARARDAVDQAVIDAAIDNLDACIDERVSRLRSFLAERGGTMPTLSVDAVQPCPLDLEADATADHVTWVQTRTAVEVEAARAWLANVADEVTASAADPEGT